MDPFRWLALLSFACLATCQTYTQLAPALTYTDGGFTSPDNTVQQVYANGSTMLISWVSNYTTINLFQVYNEDYTIQWELANELSDTSLSWIVTDHGNNSEPFNFRIVNTYGTEDEQTNGGFASGQFWISPGESPVTVTVQQVITSATAPTSVSDTSTSFTSGDAGASTTTSTTVSTTPSTSASTAVSSSTTTVSGAAATTSAASPSKSSNDSVAIGIGVGVGVGVVVVALGAFAAWWFFRRRRTHEPVAQQPPMEGAPDRSTGIYSPDARSTQFSDHSPGPGYTKYGSPPLSQPPPDQYGYYKPEQQAPVEAPNGWDEAHELHADPRST